MASSVERGSRFRSEMTATEVEFREQGSRRTHQGNSLHLQAERVAFETEFAVVPGAFLRLRIAAEHSFPEPVEAEMEVERVDTRPGSRFRVTGRLRRAR